MRLPGFGGVGDFSIRDLSMPDELWTRCRRWATPALRSSEWTTVFSSDPRRIKLWRHRKYD